MVRIFMDGKEISQESLKNYELTFNPSSKRLTGLKRKESTTGTERKPDLGLSARRPA